MILIIFPDRNQIIPFFKPFRDAKFNVIWAIDADMATHMMDDRRWSSVRKAFVYPGTEDIVNYLGGSRFSKAELFWLKAPGENISVPDIGGKVIQDVSTAMTVNEFCHALI